MSRLGNLSIRLYQQQFFRPQTITDPVKREQLRKLSRAAAYSRGATRNLLSKQRPRQKIKQLSADEAKRFRQLKRIAKQQGRPAPKLPRINTPTPRGAPPYKITGHLRRHIYFAHERPTDTFVIGAGLFASKAHGTAPATLEHGGRTRLTAGPDAGKSISVAPHPYVEPGLQATLKRRDLFP